MTRWKDFLPEYEPENGSWEKLEKKLHFEEQLRRELPNLPRHEPGKNSWDQIVSRLPGHVRRLTIYSSAAAAVFLIFAVSAVLFLPQKTPVSNDKSPRQSASRKPFPPRDTAGHRMTRPAGPGERQPALAGDNRQQEKVPGSANPPRRVANGGLVEINSTKLPTDTRPEPIETPQTIAEPAGLPADSSQSMIADADPKIKAGHHRIIQVQWKESKKTSLKLTGVPSDASETKEEAPRHLIQIKL